jgi:hypothetical protein
VLITSSIVNDAGTYVGLMAGAIAVGGFLAHASPVLSGANEHRVRSRTVIGGLGGLTLAVFTILLDGWVR